MKLFSGKYAVIILILSVFAILAVWSYSHFASAGAEIKHVLLISIDTCRADHLSCYGYNNRITPNIDALAKQGTRFENVISPIPLTLPAHSSMLTGLIPPGHNVHDNFNYHLDESNITLAEILKENGFNTGAIVSAFILDSQFGINQGFDTYNDKIEDAIENVSGFNERRGDEATRFAIDWLDEHKEDEKFFLFLHYYDPHTDYNPPEPFASRFILEPYAGEIAFTDHCVGQVIDKLKELGLYESTLIIVTGDHGEMLGEHEETDHAYFIYQSAIKVPLIVKSPGKPKNNTVKEVVGIIDVLPTVCGQLNIESPANIQGIDLSQCLKGGKYSTKDRHMYCESMTPTKYNGASLLGILNNRYKYIQTTRCELYNIAQDPREANNLFEKESQRARIMRDKLSVTLEESASKDFSFGKTVLDSKTRQRLESIGYVGASVDEDYSFDQKCLLSCPRKTTKKQPYQHRNS